MPAVIFPGPEGRLEGRFPARHPPARARGDDPPPAPAGRRHDERPRDAGAVQDLVARGFATLRFNFRGVGRSQGSFDNGIGELSDAAAALDWVQSIHPESSTTWIAGYSFGALIAMQLLMRRPEIRGFISVSPRQHV
jgi:alpha/beta superfamily hydrolase